MTRTSKCIRWLLRSLAVFVVIAIAAFVVWRVNLAHDVDAKLQAIRAAGLPTNGKELNAYYPAVPDNENAALVMTQAFALMRNYPDSRSNEIDQIQSFPARWQHPTNEQIQLLTGYVEMNSNALAKMAEALKLPKSRYPVDFSPGFETLLPHLDKVKELALLSEYRAVLAIDSGQPTNADTSVKDIFGMARTLDEEPELISQLVRFALVRIAIVTLEDRLNAGELSDAELANLANVFAQQKEAHFIARGLIGERAMVVPFFRTSFAKLKQLSNFEAPQAESPAPQRPSLFLKTTGFFERDLFFYLGAMETNIFFANLPPPQNLAITNFSKKMAENARNHYCIFSALLLPAISSSLTREADDFARIRLATTAIAVEHYRLLQGRLPDNLSELTPQFLPNVPIDPFDGALLRYHRLANGYVIYSVDRDGHDDGGRKKPADWRPGDKTTYDITFTVER
jgi:type II secretory pathway pseudopilin PulG